MSNPNNKISHYFKVFFLWQIIFFTNALFGQKVTASANIEIREVRIPMRDGIQLAADLYIPLFAKGDGRFPILLEYLPYRKDEGRGNRFPLFSYFINNGYIVARVDIRGTGRSEGRLVDGEYSEQEQLDGEQVIDWLSKQEFSTGKVGMFGISWGGFNALHMAMRHPPALKTIISLMSTDDIYQDDVHFIDGMMHIDAYEIGQDLANALPGAPDFKIDEDYFKNRFDTEPWLLKYKRQQTDGPFWNRASLNEDYSRIDIPTFIIGGWYDGYRDFIPRMLQHADVPVKAILGPWNHTWPNWASPEPAIEWRERAVSWLDYWLKDVNTGIMEEPQLYYYQRNWHAPGTDLDTIPGSWRESEGWPQTRDTLLLLQADHQLGMQHGPFQHSLEYKPTAGIEASGSVMWWGDWAPDQKGADKNSLVYDSAPMQKEVEIIGYPEVTLQTSTNAPAANWLVRLSDIAPDGRVTQITGAGFNATHYKSAENPVPLVSDSLYTLHIQLHVTSWTFQKGHKIRLAINNAQWPMIWPTPYQMTTTIHATNLASSSLLLPLGPKNASPMRKPFLKPVVDPILPGYRSLAAETVSGFAEMNGVQRDESTQTTTVIATNSGRDQYPWGIEEYTEEITHEVSDKHPSEGQVHSTYTTTIAEKDQQLKLTGQLHFYSDTDDYFYEYTRILEKDGRLVRKKTWNEKIPRR
ncbi:MAG: CocE/NonD family hydrolase [Maribacter sp.]|nr:CocE/NonD family hydrolase [Maribacter sp.]